MKCSVPGCIRFAGAMGVCNRCWEITTADERTGLQFARYAPFWSRRGVRRGARDTAPEWRQGELAMAGTVPDLDIFGDEKFDGVTAGDVMHDFEMETTRAALCAAIYDRRRYQFTGYPEGERP